MTAPHAISISPLQLAVEALGGSWEYPGYGEIVGPDDRIWWVGTDDDDGHEMITASVGPDMTDQDRHFTADGIPSHATADAIEAWLYAIITA